jgi:hypothetical protein
MKRQDLEALSATELQQLIADAAAVLAGRCSAAPASGGMFTFGGSSSGGSGGLFGPPPRQGVSQGSMFTFGSATAAEPSASDGSGKLFGGTGGGLFGGACATATPSTVGAWGTPSMDHTAASQATGDAEADEDELVQEDDVQVVNGWTPSVNLEVLDSVETGEEGEEELWSQRSKLYRFRDNEWKERGLGEAKLLKDKGTGRVRFLLRQEKTLKVAANHFVVEHDPYCDLRPNADSQKIWCWSAQDFAEGSLEVERFALKFGQEEFALKFKEAFDDAKAQNSAVMAEQLKK